MWDALENRAPAEKKAAAVQRKNVARSLMSLFKRGCGASVSAFSASSPHHLSGRPGKMMGGKMIRGKKHWLWRAVDQDGVVLDVLVQSRRDKRAAKRLLRKLSEKQCRAPRVMITD